MSGAAEMVVLYLGLCAIAADIAAALYGGPILAGVGTAVCAAAGLAGIAVEAASGAATTRGRDARLTASLGALAVAALLVGDPDPMSSGASAVRWGVAAAVGAWVWGLFRLGRLVSGPVRRETAPGSEPPQAGPIESPSGRGGTGPLDVLALVVYLVVLWGAVTSLSSEGSFGHDVLFLAAFGIAVLAGIALLAVMTFRLATIGPGRDLRSGAGRGSP